MAIATKSPTREALSYSSDQLQPRRQNAYNFDGEYEFAIAQHWIAPEATPFPGESGGYEPFASEFAFLRNQSNEG